ncbi:unnamed protein product [Adineta steineri]|uniref:Uncharacterized protein n=1 Tax=Adineta steineri TaxID=433720 RepID=A0A815SWK4_9BILA|nr:unnamed protein product [Adineta steineri]CAF1497262.1 unnamed protein product [Adineta steineri]
MAIQNLPSVNLLTVNEATNEKFEEVDAEGGTLLLDNGRRCESAKYRIPGFAQGSGSYSSGIHHIRFKVLRGLLFVGIRSRNLPVQAANEGECRTYIRNSCTCGWYNSGPSIVHGELENKRRDVSSNNDNTFVFTLNCDERRLSIMFPNGSLHDEMEVDLLRTPFPWRFCIEFTRLGGCLSLT